MPSRYRYEPLSIPIPPDIANPKSRRPPLPPCQIPSTPDNNHELSRHHDSDPYPSPTPSANVTQICEFTTPCTTHLDPHPHPNPIPNTSPSTPLEPPPPRKLITHIFGRNKLSTRLFPPSVWVHYCRKHYQRARYRAPNWAVTQVDLVFVSLERMAVWGGVRAFEVVLRKRAMDLELGMVLRGEEEEEGEGIVDGGERGGAGVMRRKQRQTAVAARSKGKAPQRKKPTMPRGSVPSWLREHLGPNKSFAEVRTMLELLKTYLKEEDKRRQRSPNATKRAQLRFPDIEILPVFMEWVGAGGKNGVATEPFF
ncbi:putative pathogenicity factor [Aspergillus melleus]|uniref:putative pathogenicity factor n=1 Tax=Aspergillus melleus TaxID=138277 RepID=UPI001E8D5CC1|nr:uncharacterized protein LDX57_001205 [Aspergillus melleus]KAH8423444.1 hypothetical protein LDX57_001205 [Aspergillus melleus]